MSSLTTPVTLEGLYARLEPLSYRHHDDLAEAVCDGELWRLWYTSVPTPDGMASEIERRLSLHTQGSMLPFAVVALDGPLIGKAVGMTGYLHIDAPHRRVEIGTTWYRQTAQRSAINTTCKRLLLAHAFEQLDCIAVELRTHRLNHASRRSIERLGAQLDGILRNHQINPHPDAAGSLRDTCVYSIIDSEWPTVRAHLDHQLNKPRG